MIWKRLYSRACGGSGQRRAYDDVMRASWGRVSSSLRKCRVFFFSSRRRHTRWNCDWSSDVCSSDLDLRQRLLNRATEAVRTKLLSRAPPHLFEEIRSAITKATASADREMSRVRDFTERSEERSCRERL